MAAQQYNGKSCKVIISWKYKASLFCVLELLPYHYMSVGPLKCLSHPHPLSFTYCSTFPSYVMGGLPLPNTPSTSLRYTFSAILSQSSEVHTILSPQEVHTISVYLSSPIPPLLSLHLLLCHPFQNFHTFP